MFSIEEKLHAELDIRYPVTVTQEAFWPGLKHLAEEAGFTAAEVKNDPPYYIDKNHPFVQILLEASGSSIGTWKLSLRGRSRVSGKSENRSEDLCGSTGSSG